MTHVDTHGRKLGARAERTRAAILESAKELLNEIPLHNMTVKNVVDGVGASTATFWQYFAHLDDLIRELAKEAKKGDKSLWAQQVRHAAGVLKQLTGE